MLKSKVQVAIFLLILLLSSCVTQNKCLKKYPQPLPDTNVEVKEVIKYRDTTIYVSLPADTVKITDTIIIGANGLINYPLHRLDVDYAYSTVQIKNSKLEHKLYQKESIIKQVIDNAVKESSRIEIITIKEPYPIGLSWWQQTLIKGGYVLIVLIIIVGVYFLLRIRLPILK